MKKILLGVSFLVCSAGVLHAQNSIVSENGDTARVFYSGSSDMNVYNRLRTTGATSKIEWRFVQASSSIPSGWTMNGVCDNILCLPLSTISSGNWQTTDSVDNAFSNSAALPGDENDFHVQFSNMTTAPNGVAVVRTEVRLPNGGSSTLRPVTFVATKSAQGVSVIRSEDAVVLYPNPATDALNVVFDERTGVKNIAIYNLIGQPVSVFHVQGGSAKLPLGDAPAGVYFARLLDAQGHILATRRFTRQ